eukprot:Phypoly_transcript_06532.p1 GENE.Phypoly_transcript_06532~~Phypoly_transcript_06532.p1  ORF type:complete len:267 (+),score=51.27 Phypoly_transcript_06532:956-1756(+)
MEVNKLFNVKGKVVLVTGGSRGIGLYIAQGFVANGAHVFIVSRNFETCKKTAEELTRAGPGKCTALKGDDLSTRDACVSVAKELAQHTQKLHVLVNNSGTSWGGPFEKYEEKGWDKVMALNVKGVFYLTQVLAPYLEAAATKEDPARVINVGSIAGLFPQKVPTYAYDLSKASVHHLTLKLAAELGPRGIAVNAIAPGFVPSKMSDQLLHYGDKDTFSGMTSLGRIGNPNDMAGVSLFLASQAGAWVTGAIIPVDGGSLVKPAAAM